MSNDYRNLTDGELRSQIANAKWGVEYDRERLTETSKMDKDRGILGRVFDQLTFGKDPLAETAATEANSLQQSLQHLTDLSREASQRGLDTSYIPALPNHRLPSSLD